MSAATGAVTVANHGRYSQGAVVTHVHGRPRFGNGSDDYRDYNLWVPGTQVQPNPLPLPPPPPKRFVITFSFIRLAVGLLRFYFAIAARLSTAVAAASAMTAFS